MTEQMKNYLATLDMPWGKLFYRIIWAQLPRLENANVLDFGSGFGVTANHLAKDNHVTAVEPNEEMLEARWKEYKYEQVAGNIEWLKNQESCKYDFVICHNVFEYAAEREELVKEFIRVLKPNGMLSIVKHNYIGKIMQKVVFENKYEEAMTLLNGNDVKATNFGLIHNYENEDILKWAANLSISIKNIYGVRTFFALQRNEFKADPKWGDNMFEMEMKVSDVEELKKIAFFNHILIEKNKV